MRVIFLDYDGVVNIPIFDENGEMKGFNFPKDNKVNHFQGVCWLNKLCKETDSKIVVTSTWRLYGNYKECLYNGGLDKDIEILGRTEEVEGDRSNRGKEIKLYLEDHPEVEEYIILDDEIHDFKEDKELYNRFIQTETYIGINWGIYERAKLKMLNLLD